MAQCHCNFSFPVTLRANFGLGHLFWRFLDQTLTQSVSDERYQLGATIMIYYHKYLYIFRASICPSSGVQIVCYCIWCSAIGVVAVVLRSRCVVLCTQCNCCIKLVPLVIFIYDARSHIQEILNWIGCERERKNVQLSLSTP